MEISQKPFFWDLRNQGQTFPLFLLFDTYTLKLAKNLYIWHLCSYCINLFPSSMKPELMNHWCWIRSSGKFWIYCTVFYIDGMVLQN